MLMPGRQFTNGNSYRFGFNGKENDNEVKGTANSIDFGARIYDSRLGRWLSIDPMQMKYPNLTPFQFGGNNPVLFCDKDGKDFGINIDDKSKVITIRATYYTVADNIVRVGKYLSHWNNVSGQFYYRTGTRKNGYEFYAINFELKAEPSLAPGEAASKNVTGNSVVVVSDEKDKNFKAHSGWGAYTENKKYISVRSSRRDQELPSAHEVGHTLIGGEGHIEHTIMNESINGSDDPNSTDYGITDKINESVLEAVLGSAGLGDKMDIDNNLNSKIHILKSGSYESLERHGKVISAKKAMRQSQRQTQRHAKRKN